MNLFYFFQKYLDKLNNTEFRIKWEKFVHSKIKRFITSILIIWALMTLAFGYLMYLISGIFFGFILMIFFAAYFGYIMFVQSIKFLAFNNTRYLQVQMGDDEDIINYDNVVG